MTIIDGPPEVGTQWRGLVAPFTGKLQLAASLGQDVVIPSPLTGDLAKVVDHMALSLDMAQAAFNAMEEP